MTGLISIYLSSQGKRADSSASSGIEIIETNSDTVSLMNPQKLSANMVRRNASGTF